ncbi:MAG TPA: FecR family protein [Candidatus Binatia bacterium]|nr:FecR family protein [Candidatus Binatia bacterium]
MRSRLTVVVFVLLVATPMMWAQAQEVGTIASIDGRAEIGRGGAWSDAAAGAAIQLGDVLRTGKPGRVRVVFQDDSVLTVSENSEVRVDEQTFNPNKGQATSLMGLLRGKVNAVVSEYYHNSANAFEIKTPNATAGVRGTEFTIGYDADAELTEVVGISGHITVHSALDPSGPGVLITASQTTTILKNQQPTAPRRINEELFRQQLEGFDFVGGGRPESLVANNAVRTGANVPAPDRAPVVIAAVVPTNNLGTRGDTTDLIGQPPQVVKALTGQLGIVLPK